MKMAWHGFDALSILLTLVLLGSLQHIAADPRPDFAIKATITGTAKVTALSTQVSSTFNKVDNLNVTLTSGHNLLGSMKNALLQIGTRVTNSGMAISAALNTLTGDSSNNVSQLFQSVYGAINALSTLLQTGLQVNFPALQLQGTYITTKLTDGFNTINSTLTRLSGALGRLQAGVTAARDAPGNTANAVSAANLRKYVTATMTLDVQNALTVLNADIPLIQFIIESTQKRLVLADVYVIEMTDEAQGNAHSVDLAYILFQAEVTTIGQNVSDGFVNVVSPSYESQLSALSQVQSAIGSLDTYADDLQPALTSLSQLLNATAIATLSTTIQGVFNTYNTAVDGTIADGSSVEDFFVTEACTALEQVVGALVASGNYAEYCFAKYSKTVFNQFARTYYLVSNCYDIETTRLQRLQDLAAMIIDMIIYDIEDLGEAITSCAPLNDGAPCLTLIGPHYETLATTIADKQQYLINYITNETGRSQQRLSSCVTVAKYSMVTALVPILINLGTCTVNGP